jgi:hypothetical protein
MAGLTCDKGCEGTNFRSQETKDKHDARHHKGKVAVAAAEKVLAKAPKDKTMGNTQQALKESIQQEEGRRAAAAVIKAATPRDRTTLPVINWRMRLVWDTKGRDELDVREAAVVLLKRLRKDFPDARIDLESFIPMI